MEAQLHSDLLDTTKYQTKHRSWWSAISDKIKCNSQFLSRKFSKYPKILCIRGHNVVGD